MKSFFVIVFSTFTALVIAIQPCCAEEKSFMDKVGDAVGGTLDGVGGALGDVGDSISGSETAAEARAEIDKETKDSIPKLTQKSAAARILHEKAYGYAVFDSRKFSFLLTTGGGAGVAVVKDSGQRTYMKMFTAGGGLGGGLQFFQLVVLFENKQSFDKFVNEGWEANAAASAVFGDDALEKNARFVEGMAVFQMNDAGIMANLNITGTKYWKSDKLNSYS